MNVLSIDCGMLAVVAGYQQNTVGPDRLVSFTLQPSGPRTAPFSISAHLTPDEARALSAMLTAAAEKADGAAA